MKKGVVLIAFCGGCIYWVHANSIINDVNSLSEQTKVLSNMPVMTIQYIHVFAASLILTLIFIIAMLRWRLNRQRKKQMFKDRAVAEMTEALNKRYRLVLQANHTIVWTWDLRAKTIDCESDHYCEDCKRGCKEYRITEEMFYDRIHPDFQQKMRDIYLRLMNGDIHMLQEEFRYKLVSAPDEYTWVENFAIVSETDEEGHALVLVGGLVSVNERKRLEEVSLKKKQAEESSRMKSAFLSGIRHEVRTPLNAIVGFSGLIANGVEPEEAREYSEIIQQNNLLLVKLIDDVLDLSDIESGLIELQPSAIDISEMLLMLERSYRPKVREGVKLRSELKESSCFAWIDGRRVEQVLKNFLSNACKYTLSGSIYFGFEHTKNGLYFYVTDTGKGISKENVPQVFDRFAKFDPFAQGIGLGLAVCQTLVYKMKGDIGVYSEEGKGSTFWFTIPCEVGLGINLEELDTVDKPVEMAYGA